MRYTTTLNTIAGYARNCCGPVPRRAFSLARASPLLHEDDRHTFHRSEARNGALAVRAQFARRNVAGRYPDPDRRHATFHHFCRPTGACGGHQLTADVIADWGTGDDSFIKNPPNATVSVFAKDGSVKDAVVVLKNPKLDGDKLTFNVQTLEGDINGGDGGAALFIDIIGRPFTPLSFAGVARRSAFRGAMYAGAVGAAAYGAAAYAAPYPYARPVCGYYPYPPCY